MPIFGCIVAILGVMDLELGNIYTLINEGQQNNSVKCSRRNIPVPHGPCLIRITFHISVGMTLNWNIPVTILHTLPNSGCCCVEL